jgi:hypothetical protein
VTAPEASGAPIHADVRLAQRDVMAVSSRLLLVHRLSLTAIASGPVLWLTGIAGGSAEVTRLGLALLWLVVLVPFFAFLVGTFNAYRPGTGELYEPVRYDFADGGVEIEQPGRRAHADWDEFRSWRTVGAFYLLDVSKSRYLLVPKSAVPAAERTALEALFEDHLGARRR